MSNRLRFRFQTIEYFGHDLHIRSLRDRQQFQDNEGAAESLGIHSSTWSLFGVIWPSGEALSQVMVDYDIAGLKILEIGCGLGLSSHVLNHRNADITATDYHPEAQSFLNYNSQLNDSPLIPFVRSDWKDDSKELGQYDLIIGSDLLYEPNHAELLSEFIQRHAKNNCRIILTDPGRGNTATFTKRLLNFGFILNDIAKTQEYQQRTNYKGKFYCYFRQ